jgi:hypothetical protein
MNNTGNSKRIRNHWGSGHIQFPKRRVLVFNPGRWTKSGASYECHTPSSESSESYTREPFGVSHHSPHAHCKTPSDGPKTTAAKSGDSGGHPSSPRPHVRRSEGAQCNISELRTDGRHVSLEVPHSRDTLAHPRESADRWNGPQFALNLLRMLSR